MSHLLSETARAAHCASWCKSLMSLKHPEMLELSGKRFSVLSTERYERQCGCKRHVYPRTIAKLKVHAAFFFWRLCHRSRQHHINTSFGCRHTTKKVVGWCRLGSYRLGGGGGGGFNPGITHNFPDKDGRRTYNMCLASANQICTFFKVTQLL